MMKVRKKLMTSENVLGKIILEEKKTVFKDFTELLLGYFSGNSHSEKKVM